MKRIQADARWLQKARGPTGHCVTFSTARNRNVYRVIYAIDEQKKLVRVLTIRHGAMEPADLNE